MSETKTKHIPKLRFKEFDGEWKIILMEKIYPFIRNGFVGTATPYYIENGVKYLQGKNVKGNRIKDDGMIYINDFFHNKNKKSQLKLNDIVMVQSGHVGECAVITETYVNANCHALLVLTPTEEVNSFFYSYFYYSPYGLREIYKIRTGNTIAHVLSSDVKKIDVPFPILPEQQKIAAFLSAVDAKIQQLSKKKELLEDYKKGVMQQLFSQQLRFKQDNGETYPDWEEKLLDDVANIKRGASPRPISDPKWFDTDSKIGWVRISDVTKSNKYLEKTTQYLTAEGVAKSRLVATGSMIMSICATIGKPIYTKFEVCIHDGFVVFENLQANKEFLYYFLDKIQLQWYRYGQPGSQVNLNSTIVGNETMPYPCIEEQQKIATYLSSIDTKIEGVAQQIEKTQEFKKGLLQQMFI